MNATPQLKQVCETLKNVRSTAKDYIMSTKDIIARPTEAGSIVLQLNQIEETPNGGKAYGLTNWAHGQVAAYTGIPKSYYDKLREAKRGDLLADNVNAWIAQKPTRMVKTVGNTARALLSDRYMTIDNHDLFFVALNEVAKENGIVQHAALTETTMYLKAVSPRLQGEVKKGDIVQGGICLRNSEVGASRFVVEPFLLRLTCTNGMVVMEGLGIGGGISRVHVGKRLDEGVVDWSNETKLLEGQLAFNQVKDVIAGMFQPEKFNAIVGRLAETATVPVSKPVQGITNTVKALGLTEACQEAIINAFVSEKDYTQWGAVNAITAVAKDIEDADRQYDLQSAASGIAYMKDTAFLKLVEKEGDGNGKAKSAGIKDIREWA